MVEFLLLLTTAVLAVELLYTKRRLKRARARAALLERHIEIANRRAEERSDPEPFDWYA